jgi:hypothetical protein
MAQQPPRIRRARPRLRVCRPLVGSGQSLPTGLPLWLWSCGRPWYGGLCECNRWVIVPRWRVTGQEEA